MPDARYASRVIELLCVPEQCFKLIEIVISISVRRCTFPQFKLPHNELSRKSPLSDPLSDKVAFAIKCYECSVHPKRNGNNTSFDTVCTKFDESERFEVDCPFSTMCKKRVYRYQLINTVQESIERGCADQRNDSMVSTFRAMKVAILEQSNKHFCNNQRNIF